MANQIRELRGQRFGKLLAIEQLSGRTKGRQVLWKTRCNCGNIGIVASGDLTKKNGVRSCGCTSKFPKGQAILRRKYRHYRKDAERRSLTFSLTFEEFQTLTARTCSYCGSLPREAKLFGMRFNGSILFNGVDRIDNSLGYSIENCATACFTCNRAKHTQEIGQFLEWLDSRDGLFPRPSFADQVDKIIIQENN